MNDALRIAVVDDDSGFERVLAKRAEPLDWRLHVARALSADDLVALRVHAVVVDPTVLGADGWSQIEMLCRRLPALAVIVCTAPSSVADRVRGLRLGLDDWVTKPCHPEELIARIEAAVRRGRRADARVAGERLAAGELVIRPDQFEAFVDGRAVGLTRREFELIHLLAQAHGQVLPREEIYERVWGYAMAHGDRSVDVFVRKLRQKLQRASSSWRYIHTHFGVGYRFAAERVDLVAVDLPPGEDAQQGDVAGPAGVGVQPDAVGVAGKP